MSFQGADGTADVSLVQSSSLSALPTSSFCFLDILLSILHSLHVSTCSNIFILCIPCGTTCSATFLFDILNSTPTRVLLDCGASDCFISPNLTPPLTFRMYSHALTFVCYTVYATDPS